jgi:hypothetical protein
MAFISEARAIWWLIEHASARTFERDFNAVAVPFMVLLPSILLGSTWLTIRGLANKGELSEQVRKVLLKDIGSAFVFTYVAMSFILGIVCG